MADRTIMKDYIIELGGKIIRGHFSRNYFIKNDESFENKKSKYINECDYKDVFQCLYEYETNDYDTCKIISDVYFDFDAPKLDEEHYNRTAFEVRLAYNYLTLYVGVPKEYIRLYFTGNKGFHIVIPYQIFNISPSITLNEDIKAFILYLKEECNLTQIDRSIYDRKRLFRIPNTINTKSNLYKVPITIEQVYAFKLKNIITYASTPQYISYTEKEPEVVPKAAQFYQSVLTRTIHKKPLHIGPIMVPQNGEVRPLLPCAERLIEEGVEKGARNNALVILSSSLIQSGISPEEAYEIITEWNESKVNPPLDDRELQTTFNSAYAMLKQGKGYGCAAYKEIDMCVGESCRLLQPHNKNREQS